MKKKIKSLNPLKATGTRKIKAITFSLALIYSALGFYWGMEPQLPLKGEKSETSSADIVGLETVSATIDIAEAVLSKPGGYLYNDAFPPGILMDNIPNWELGALVQLKFA